MSYIPLDNSESDLFYPLAVSYGNIQPGNRCLPCFTRFRKTLIFIGLIFLILALIGIITPITIILSRSRHEQPFEHQHFPFEHTVTSTITTNPIKVDHGEIFTCNISFTNATWDQVGVIFVNRLGRCSSDDDGLCHPFDLFIDNIHDNLYVVDSNNRRIQKYSLNQLVSNEKSATGITVASQNLMSPSSIFVDVQTEDMYILDYNRYRDKNRYATPNYRVQLWPKNADVGRILLEEHGERLFGWYSHIVLDKYMDIYVETRYHIRKWLASTNYTQVITVAGMSDFGGDGSDQLNDPRGLYVDNDLTMYIADWNNHRVQKLIMNATKGITLASNLSYVNGITQDCSGNLYYSDMYRNSIYQLNLETNQTRIVISNDENIQHGHMEGLFLPYGMKLDRFGNMFVIDSGHERIRKYSIL